MIVALYKSARDVVRAEKILTEKGYNVFIRPVPENISSECGMCIYFDESDSININNLMIENSIVVEYGEI